MKKPTLSVCMIVKNEQDVLGRCLESVQGVADEIIVVDTGSTDRTKEIASQYGATLFDFEWQYHFALARNFALAQATSDWVLQLDADEYLTESTRAVLKGTIEQAQAYAVNVQIHNYNDRQQNYVLHQYPRLYRNVPEIRYQNRIHEQLLYDGKPMETEESEIHIIHLGYTEEIVRKKNKKARNIRLLQEELRDNPTDGFMHFNLANELMKQRELKKALKHYQIAYKETTIPNVQTASLLQIVKVLIQQKDYEQALLILKDAIPAYPDYTDLLYIEGEVYEELGREEEAVAVYQACLRLGEAPKRYMTTAGVGSFYPMHKLAYFALLRRDFEAALGYLTEMTDTNPYSYVHVAQVIGLLIPMFGKEQVIEFIHETYSSEQEKDLLFKNQLAHQFRFYREFSLLLPKTEQHFSEEERAILRFYLHLGEAEGKERALQFTKQQKTRHFAFLYYLLTKDEEVKNALLLDKTCGFMITQLAGVHPYPKKNKYKKELYVALLQELMKIEQYALVEELVPLAPFFDPHAFVDIGDLFFSYHQDDLAIEYYTKYLLQNKQDFTVYVKTARLLYHSGLYKEAMLFAEEAYKLNPVHFKSMELLLESANQLGLMDTKKQLALAFLQTYPDSAYLLEQAK